MKKITKIIIAVFVAVTLLTATACVNKTESENLTEINIIVPNGSPAVSIAKLMSEKDSLQNINLNYKVVDPSLIVQTFTKNEAQMGIVPTNMAALLYNNFKNNNKDAFTLLSVNVHGSLYLVGNSQINSLEGLKGKQVFSIGEGGTPGIIFRHILQSSGIEFEQGLDSSISNKVVINYQQSAEVLNPMLIKGEIDYAILGEPAVSQVISKNPNLKVVLDLQQAWKTATNADYDGIPQASLIVKNSLVASHPQLIKDILSTLSDNADWVKNNIEKAKEAITKHEGIIPILNAELVNRSNIRVVKAKDAKIAIEEYFKILKSINPGLIGGKLPENDFYYAG